MRLFFGNFQTLCFITYPAAQLPLSRPPLSVHSVEVKQVPFLESLADLQSKFWKVTMENRLNSKVEKEIKLIKSHSDLKE